MNSLILHLDPPVTIFERMLGLDDDDMAKDIPPCLGVLKPTDEGDKTMPVAYRALRRFLRKQVQLRPPMDGTLR